MYSQKNFTGYPSVDGVTKDIYRILNKLETGVVQSSRMTYNLTSGYIPYYNGSSLVDSVIYTDGTKIGIGTNTPSADLEVAVDGGSIKLTDSGDSGNMRVQVGHINGSGGYVTLFNDSTVSTARLYSFAVSGTQAYFTAGNIGIGTYDPSTLLGIYHDTEDTLLSLESGDSEALIAFMDSNSTGSWDDTSIGCAGDDLIFKTSNDEKVRIKDSGSVGIGIDSPSGGDGSLDVYGSNHSIRLTDSGDSGSLRVLLRHSDNFGGYISVYDETATARARISGYASSGVQAYFTAGNVGIGLDNPSELLHVDGNTKIEGILNIGTVSNAGIDTDKFLVIDGSGNVDFRTGSEVLSDIGGSSSLSLTTNYLPKAASSTSLNNSIIYEVGSKIGIGTISPDYTLHVDDTYGAIKVSSQSDNAAIYISADEGNTALSTNQDPRLYFYSANVVRTCIYFDEDLGNFSVGTSYNVADFVVHMSNGYVGVGTTDPTADLEVAVDNGSIKLTDSSDSFSTRAQIGNVSSSGSYFNLYDNSSSLTARIRSYASSGVQAYFTAGNVGIGTSTPDTLLHIYNSSSDNLMLIESGDSYAGITFKDSGSTGSWYDTAIGCVGDDIVFRTSNDEKLRLLDNGNLGIGLDNPSELLHLEAASAPKVIVTNTVDSGQSRLAISDGNGGYLSLYDDSGATNVLLRSYGDSYFNGGDFGLGVTDPSYQLHVVGTTMLDGTVRVDTDNGNSPFWVTRLGDEAQGLQIWATDRDLYLKYLEDTDEGLPGTIHFQNAVGGGSNYEYITVKDNGDVDVNYDLSVEKFFNYPSTDDITLAAVTTEISKDTYDVPCLNITTTSSYRYIYFADYVLGDIIIVHNSGSYGLTVYIDGTGTGNSAAVSPSCTVIFRCRADGGYVSAISGPSDTGPDL